MTRLTKPLQRETNQLKQRRKIVVVLFPGSNSRPDLIAMRLKGTRTMVSGSVESVYTVLCDFYARKTALAKREARKNGIRWAVARKTFERNQRISL